MFNTLAYYFGYNNAEASERLPELENTPAGDFNITELTEEEGWGLVEKVLMKRRSSQDANSHASSPLQSLSGHGGNNHLLTPPPSPPSECSWVVAPPACFDAELDDILLDSSERENLMIEHPSIFVPNLKQDELLEANENSPPPPPALPVVATNIPVTSSKRSQRRATRQALKAAQKKRSVQKPLKQKNQNRNFNKMRLLVQQPRKANY